MSASAASTVAALIGRDGLTGTHRTRPLPAVTTPAPPRPSARGALPHRESRLVAVARRAVARSWAVATTAVRGEASQVRRSAA